ncbi:hypothetical protein DUNSADRAFT_17431 [Dunaliella salina]|uniref:Uncharacterized protein n=1 Tax=Dunaliella salina TaxID=3046 RepID=A0ABQ7H031_DUNSA|nr:hypothetical protein DUNSADRAFT_17431 [Dunaliella salina]|eukprot:KAF5840214.1 hypothetical protein DUNSADRAFT_17431 [Dunaliella salina]
MSRPIYENWPQQEPLEDGCRAKWFRNIPRTQIIQRWIDHIGSRALQKKRKYGFTYFQKQNPVEWKKHVRVVHYRHMNSWEATYRNGSLIFHSAGGAHKREKYSNSVFPKCQESNAKTSFARQLKPSFLR